MSKVKYYYDSENLAYRKIKTRKRIKFGVIILFLLAAALFGFLSFIILLNTPYFETPKDRLQTREIEHLRLNYALLNKKMDQLNAVVDAIEDRDNNLYRVYFNKSAIPDSIRKEGFLGKNRYKILEGYDNSQLVINTTKRIDVLSKELAIQSKSLDDILKLADAKSDLLAAIPAIQPVRNENLKQMASGFGYRTDPFTKARKMHEGILKYKYDKENIVELIVTEIFDKPITTKCSFEYKFDDKNNWIEQSKYINGKKLYVWKRKIIYYE